MIGIVVFILFLALGEAMASRVFSAETHYVRAWAGGVIGVVGAMWLVVPFAFFLGFTPISHILAFGAMVILTFAVRHLYRGGNQAVPEHEDVFPVFCATTFSLSVVICILLLTHVIAPGKNGGLYVGQSTFGDLSLHLGIATSIATQQHFPPDYSIFPGHLLGYPFLVDSLSSSLYLFGTPLRWAILVPSFVMVLLLTAGLFILSNSITRNKYASALATTLFLINGGFGFAYFLDKSAAHPQNFLRIFTAFYQTPTNLNDENIRWSNTICDMIIPQRTTLAGWMVAWFVIWLVFRALREDNRKYFVFSGVMLGLMPMIHTHSFLGIAIIAATWFFVFLSMHENKRKYLSDWLCFAVVAAILAVPQLLFWTIQQSGAAGFSRIKLGWVNEMDFTVWFWIKNVGLAFILLFPALTWADKKLWSFYSGAIAIFAVANIYIFQPNDYDNNKLLYLWYVMTVIVVAKYLLGVYDRIKDMRGTNLLCIILLFFLTLSGFLTIGREFASSYELELFSPAAKAAADTVKIATPRDALFISADNHNNPISSLAGRNVFCGSPIYLAFHGLKYEERFDQVRTMYTNPAAFPALASENKIDYVYYSSYERERFKVGPEYFQRNYPVLFNQGDVMVFAISDRARALLKNH